MKKLILTALGILFVCTLWAQEVPQKISYQGKLLENGIPVNGTKNINFTIGAWSETINGVEVTEGLYSVTLGEITPIAIDVFDATSTITLQITVEGDVLNPQTEILSVPYAFIAEKAVTASPTGTASGDLSGTYPSPTVAKIQNRAVSTSTPMTDQVLKWDGTQWALASDDTGGSPSGTASGDLSGTYPNPTVAKIQNRAVSTSTPITDQVLKWNGTEWAPGTDDTGTGGDNWGTQTVQTDATLIGDGTLGSPLSIDQQGATAGQVLEWNGSQWAPATDNTGTGGGDDWGTQIVQSDVTLSGDGTLGSPLSIDQQGATTGQVLEWNGSAWVPGTDDTGSGGLTLPYSATYSGSNNAFDITNTGTNNLANFVINNPSSSGNVLYIKSNNTGNLVNIDNSDGINAGIYIDNGYNAGDAIRIFNNATNATSSSIDISHNGNSDALFISHGGTSGNSAHFRTTNSSNVDDVLKVINFGTGRAGYFFGNVDVTGTLSKGGGSFMIDHPLDPENKYLHHSFVESPDMMNVYNGNIVLNNEGEAIVQLPDWFEALNKDFKYQLTCIGAYAPVYISEKISNNNFKISGGTSGLEISWQVTGIRHDPYAEQNRIQVEVEKTDKEKGHYLHYKEYNQPIEKSIEVVNDPKMLNETTRK